VTYGCHPGLDGCSGDQSLSKTLRKPPTKSANLNLNPRSPRTPTERRWVRLLPCIARVERTAVSRQQCQVPSTHEWLSVAPPVARVSETRITSAVAGRPGARSSRSLARHDRPGAAALTTHRARAARIAHLLARNRGHLRGTCLRLTGFCFRDEGGHADTASAGYRREHGCRCRPSRH
jgi:hypothetical protein